MTVKLHRTGVHCAPEPCIAEGALWGPVDAGHLRARLNEIAQSRPSAVAGVLEHWLNTPHGESHFDVKS